MMEGEQTLCDILGNLLVYRLAEEHTSFSNLEADIDKQAVPD